MAQKEAQGVAEKRKGRRGPGSVVGSSAAGCVCSFLSIYGVGGSAFLRIWELGFVASFCTKLSDTVSSEIGKAYGRTTSVLLPDASFIPLVYYSYPFMLTFITEVELKREKGNEICRNRLHISLVVLGIFLCFILFCFL